MNRSFYIFTGLIAAVLLTWTSSSLLAQGVSITPDQTTMTLEKGGYYEFHVSITNNGFFPLTFYVVRTVNELPDNDWQSSICMDSFCYSATTDQTDAVTVPSKGTYNVKLNVFAGYTENTSGRFTLKFMTDGMQAEEFGSVELTANVGTVASVPAIVEPSQLPYPNPAVADITIPMTAVRNAQQVEIFNLAGTQVASFDRETVAAGTDLRLNLGDFAAGVYYYTITGTDEARSGSFNVVK